MRWWTAIGATAATALLGAVIARSALQTPAVRSVDEKVLRECAGVGPHFPPTIVITVWDR
jgi:hypothetical protein